MHSQNNSLTFSLAQAWRKILDTSTVTLSLAVVIGILTAFAAHFLHLLLGGINELTHFIVNFGNDEYARLVLLFPLPFIGITLSYAVQKVMTAKGFAKSLSPLILALDRRQEKIPFSESWTHIFSSALSVGFGGSAGLEAPSVLTGAAIGSNVASLFGINRLQRSLLVGCGSAAAISAIFGSPIAGVLFVVEAILPEFTVSALVPLLLSSAVSNITMHLLSGHEIVLLSQLTPVHAGEVPAMFFCGAFCAIIGAFIIRSTSTVGGLLKKYLPNETARLCVGGFVLCILLCFFPHLRAQGYHAIEQLLIGDMTGINNPPLLLEWCAPAAIPFIMVIAGIFIKAVVSALTIDSGGDGGIFAPTMFIGAFAGFAFARLVNLCGLPPVSENNFTALGMCGVFTAVMRSPLTGVFLIAETTGGHVLLVPLMIVSSISWAIGKVFEPQSIYRKSLVADKLICDDPDEARLKRILVAQSILPSKTRLSPANTMEEATAIIEKSNDNAETFPVINEKNSLAGMLPSEKFLTAILNVSSEHPITVEELMDPPLGLLTPDDDLNKALLNMEIYSLKNLPVADKETGRFLGIISKDIIFDKYRTMK